MNINPTITNPNHNPSNIVTTSVTTINQRPDTPNPNVEFNLNPSQMRALAETNLDKAPSHHHPVTNPYKRKKLNGNNDSSRTQYNHCNNNQNVQPHNTLPVVSPIINNVSTPTHTSSITSPPQVGRLIPRVILDNLHTPDRSNTVSTSNNNTSNREEDTHNSEQSNHNRNEATDHYFCMLAL